MARNESKLYLFGGEAATSSPCWENDTTLKFSFLKSEIILGSLMDVRDGKVSPFFNVILSIIKMSLYATFELGI